MFLVEPKCWSRVWMLARVCKDCPDLQFDEQRRHSSLSVRPPIPVPTHILPAASMPVDVLSSSKLHTTLHVRADEVWPGELAAVRCPTNECRAAAASMRQSGVSGPVPEYSQVTRGRYLHSLRTCLVRDVQCLLLALGGFVGLA
jgi:hypothetical protein